MSSPRTWIEPEPYRQGYESGKRPETRASDNPYGESADGTLWASLSWGQGYMDALRGRPPSPWAEPHKQQESSQP